MKHALQRIDTQSNFDAGVTALIRLTADYLSKNPTTKPDLLRTDKELEKFIRRQFNPDSYFSTYEEYRRGLKKGIEIAVADQVPL
jgi:hypothetical protein